MLPLHLILLLFFPLANGILAATNDRPDPVADPAAIVSSGAARFTILTPGLIRLEWARDSTFEDHASLVVINRRLPVPPYTVERNDGWLSVSTSLITLRYRESSGAFTSENVRAVVPSGEGTAVWRPGMTDTANLGGTLRTLDGVRGSTPLEPGMLSRSGWTFLDDSQRPLVDSSDWPWVIPRPEGEHQDWYLFAYGTGYRQALGDFVSVAGRIPMPPRFAFGLWWSRYWAYTDRELMDLVGEFEARRVPLSVLVVDMDWHETFELRWDTDKRDQAGQRLGWTGYTWNRAYFPDPQAFLDWCELRGIKTTLNLHPASGIQPHEEAYPAMARAMGILPETRTYIPFDIVNRRFAENYFTHVLRPLERQGVDFWWLDWQQWGTTTIPGVTPTWWLNYVHFTDMQRQGKARPLIFHRWGGLGNHRYQIGFSGDAISVWESLQFQPYFTSTAANVGFGYWSHDIGGHMPGPVSAELYTRWVQFGALSPILRTHTTKNPAAERRFWAYPDEYFTAMRDAVLFRYALIPYIYTSARQAYDTGVSICRPLYYDHPRLPEAYTFPGEYMLGEDLLVAPVTDSIVAGEVTVTKRLWIPPGEWREWSSGSWLHGPAVVDRPFSFDETPVYARAGSIIPMQENGAPLSTANPDVLVLTIIPGDSGSVSVYEDDGNSDAYRQGSGAWTPVSYAESPDGREASVAIRKAEGHYEGMPAVRRIVIRVLGVLPPVSVTCNGRPVPSWEYDGGETALMVHAGELRHDEGLVVTIAFGGTQGMGRAVVGGFKGALRRLHRITEWLNGAWPLEWSPDVLVQTVQTGRRMGLHPGDAVRELERFRHAMPEIRTKIGSMKIDEKVRARVLHHLSLISESDQ